MSDYPARKRRVRRGVGGLLAAAALIAALGACAAQDSDSGGGNIRVPSAPAAPEPQQAAPEPKGARDESEQAANRSDPLSGAEPAADAPAEPTEEEPAPEPREEESAPADPKPPDPPAADVVGGTEAATAPRAYSLPAPAEISTGAALAWTEVFIDFGTGPEDSLELLSLGDGRVVARGRVEGSYVLAITGDGTTWSDVELPDGAFPYGFSVAGDRWVVAIDDWDRLGEPPTHNTSRVLVSDDGGETWDDLSLEAAPQQALPQGCVERSAVQDVLASGESVVVVVSLHRFLDIEAILTESGVIEAGTIAQEWRRSEDTLTVRIEDPAAWNLEDPAEWDPEGQFLDVELGELGLTPEQLDDCDRYAEGRVVVLAGDRSAASRVAEFEGWATSAVATEEGFALVVANDREVRRLTSPDGQGWVRVPTDESGYGAVAIGHDGYVWLGEGRNGFSISRGTVGAAPRIVAAFDTLDPLGVLSAGPAGVAAAAWALPAELRDVIGTSFTKDGYELRMDADGATLWDLDADVAVYEFTIEQLESDEAPEGARELEGGPDGYGGVAFDDPTTGEELVRFEAEDLIPDTSQIEAARRDLFGSTGIPPIWIGWSADGERWGWQDAAEAFGLTPDEGLTVVSVAVGADFVLARFHSFDVEEVTAMAESPETADSQRGPPSSWRARWFIASVP